MTVQDFIEELNKYPLDMVIAIDGYLTEIEFKIIEDFPVGDPANPKCEYLDKILNIY